MRKVLIIDTSLLCVWLQVPGRETAGSDDDKNPAIASLHFVSVAMTNLRCVSPDIKILWMPCSYEEFMCRKNYFN